jgi:hypothetical protein
MQRSRSFLAESNSVAAIEAAREAFALARRHRAHQLLSEAFVIYVTALAADEQAVDTDEYRETVEGAFGWAETMPEEIQVWLFPFLVPHLAVIGEPRLASNAAEGGARSDERLAAGTINVRYRCQTHHLDDVAAGARIDAKALSMERMGALYADDLFDTEGLMLLDAAMLWRSAGRDDRAEFIEDLVAEIRSR